MGLVKRASKLLQRVRRRKNGSQSPLRAEAVGLSARLTGRTDRSVLAQKLERRNITVQGTDEAPPKDRCEIAMAFEVDLAHESGTDQVYGSRKPQAMADSQRKQIVEDEEEEEGGELSDEDDEEESEDEVEESVIEDMQRLEESFRGISRKYRLINRIGEGTFSTVYKAEQLPPPEGDGDDDHLQRNYSPETPDESNPPAKRRKGSFSSQASTVLKCGQRRKPQYVALKKIYVTSSPHRIQNELEILHALRSSPHICPLLTAFRHLDQVVAVLPYFRHLDFRLYYREFLISDMRHYFHSLLSALHSVHRAGILHRDIKPTNFLYDPTKRRGVLVDFGLAEKQGTDWQPCLCLEDREARRERYVSSVAFATQQANGGALSAGYPKNDTRPSKRANRAGTRGFRAPEVLFKCTAQTTKIDIWSTGVILLTLLARRFPFFNSSDDVDAMIEMASIFGKRRMKVCAAMHGSVFETNIETIGERGFTLERIVVWASCRDRDHAPLTKAELQAIAFLEGLLDLDPQRRFTAREALNHDFFVSPEPDDDDIDDDDDGDDDDDDDDEDDTTDDHDHDQER